MALSFLPFVAPWGKARLQEGGNPRTRNEMESRRRHCMPFSLRRSQGAPISEAPPKSSRVFCDLLPGNGPLPSSIEEFVSSGYAFLSPWSLRCSLVVYLCKHSNRFRNMRCWQPAHCLIWPYDLATQIRNCYLIFGFTKVCFLHWCLPVEIFRLLLVFVQTLPSSCNIMPSQSVKLYFEWL